MTTNEGVRILPAPRSEARPEVSSETPPKSRPVPKVVVPSTYVSGHCAVGNCYKTRNTDTTGKRMLPSCQWNYEYRGNKITCTHSCHQEFGDMLKAISEMAEATGSDTSFMLPVELREAANYVRTISDKRLYIPIVSVPTLEERTFGPTPTGRAARGELEDKVRKVIIKYQDFPELTPSTIGALIDKEDPPSVGAVYAVLRRWETGGFCTVVESPFRFGQFTDLGRIHLVK